MQFQKINWFPGHMKKATEAINLAKKNIDLILEIIDARGVNISTNHELLNIFTNKPLVRVALKTDLADLNIKPVLPDLLYLSKYEKNARNKILNQIEAITKTKTENLKSKGLLLPHYNIMVVGLPNVGKSTIINILTKKIKTKTENRPGVTKKITWIKLNDKFSLFDTPGILFKKIDQFDVGAKLTLMGIIKPEVVPLSDILVWGFNYLKTFYYHQLKTYYHFDEDLDYEPFLMNIAKLRNFVLQKNIYDLDRAQKSFFNDLLNGLICKINYEKV